ncbi:TPA: hypothetical protein R8F93_004591 [Enterobacter soli]|uniref:Uncharacterized protein n=1 Tax=Enterobacter soli TaxID=885040 RepID=A0AAW8H8N6_9ENTR|nr:hypothetical protein [Enterobacter soli]MDQ2256925.1 hypothetical protein [Enterobacter soli]MDQ2335259.1 hypothetical protein [Enterobacter soli]HEE9790493.1 hypothetical protein [Enterobacter soli]
MTTKNEELITRLRNSLEKANITLKLKARIEEDMSSVLDILKDLTSDSIDYYIMENSPVIPLYKDCSKLLRLKKKSNSDYSSGMILFGFSINDSTGYPLQLETESEYFECSDVDEMKECIVFIIENKSIDIMKLISEDSDFIPF